MVEARVEIDVVAYKPRA